MADYAGGTNGTGLRFAIISSRYNDFITSKLVAGARECFVENGVAPEDVDVFWCPGAMEIPALARRVARHGLNHRHYDGIVCCGCVIRGETDHYTHVSTEAIRGVGVIALEGEVGVGNAILTVENAQQAIERAGERSQNKGWEAASAALEMVGHFRRLK